MKRAIWIGGVAVVLAAIFLLGKAVVDPGPHPISGIWKNDFYGVCLCDAENFYLFEDGNIVEYSDRHLTNHNAGKYRDLGDGQYEVTLNHDGSASSTWIVRPGADSWLHPPDTTLGKARKHARRFYRPEENHALTALIASASERDATLGAAIKKNQGQQGEEADAENAVQ